MVVPFLESPGLSLFVFPFSLILILVLVWRICTFLGFYPSYLVWLHVYPGLFFFCFSFSCLCALCYLCLSSLSYLRSFRVSWLSFGWAGLVVWLRPSFLPFFFLVAFLFFVLFLCFECVSGDCVLPDLLLCLVYVLRGLHLVLVACSICLVRPVPFLVWCFLSFDFDHCRGSVLSRFLTLLLLIWYCSHSWFSSFLLRIFVSLFLFFFFFFCKRSCRLFCSRFCVSFVTTRILLR